MSPVFEKYLRKSACPTASFENSLRAERFERAAE
jgi:hypothetical protein